MERYYLLNYTVKTSNNIKRNYKKEFNNSTSIYDILNFVDNKQNIVNAEIRIIENGIYIKNSKQIIK